MEELYHVPLRLYWSDWKKFLGNIAIIKANNTMARYRKSKSRSRRKHSRRKKFYTVSRGGIRL